MPRSEARAPCEFRHLLPNLPSFPNTKTQFAKLQFILGPIQPLDQVRTGNYNWLVGDFKLTMANARSQWRIGGPKHEQLEVFAKYAKEYSFVPAVGLITLWRGYKSGRSYMAAMRQLRAAAKKHDVYLLYLVLVEGKASKTKPSSIVKRVFG